MSSLELGIYGVGYVRSCVCRREPPRRRRRCCCRRKSGEEKYRDPKLELTRHLTSRTSPHLTSPELPSSSKLNNRKMNPHPPLPRLLLLPLLLTLLLLSTTVAASQPPSKTKIISLWPLTSPSPTPWVEITLPSSGGKAEYTVLSQESEQEEKGENGGLEGLVRVGWVDDGKWTGVVRRGKV